MTVKYYTVSTITGGYYVFPSLTNFKHFFNLTWKQVDLILKDQDWYFKITVSEYHY